MKAPNPHEAPLGKYLRALARPISMKNYLTWGPEYRQSSDGVIHRAGAPRRARKEDQRKRRSKVINPPREPRRSWADVQAAWRRRKEAE